LKIGVFKFRPSAKRARIRELAAKPDAQCPKKAEAMMPGEHFRLREINL
jgi:hypothetical protein